MLDTFCPERIELHDYLPACGGVRGSLQDFVAMHGVERCGTQHTAGSDALATLELCCRLAVPPLQPPLADIAAEADKILEASVEMVGPPPGLTGDNDELAGAQPPGLSLPLQTASRVSPLPPPPGLPLPLQTATHVRPLQSQTAPKAPQENNKQQQLEQCGHHSLPRASVGATTTTSQNSWVVSARLASHEQIGSTAPANLWAAAARLVAATEGSDSSLLLHARGQHVGRSLYC